MCDVFCDTRPEKNVVQDDPAFCEYQGDLQLECHVLAVTPKHATELKLQSDQLTYFVCALPYGALEYHLE